MREMVFLVEAEIGACEQAQRCLEDAGFSVCTFSTASVIEEAQERQPSLMLVASTLPGGIGLDLCTRIRENPWLAKTPVIVLNSGPSDEARDAALLAGADD